ncbi:uncharacterized mitochondrial protein AtMg00820-like [Lycium barbarum]|uniref:uncharacterized mitochondrial protein AtMg00820-like n=1 Tax=Lycium barbarum TaxID=112863 RepID=UPI00293F5704|nr:uncharacterized mitochondrial protein AtMg00820-like [Lycium barbarum]
MQDYVCGRRTLHQSSSNSCAFPMSSYLSLEAVSPAYQLFLSTLSSIQEPQSYAEVVQDPQWVEAMEQELQALNDNQTWSMVPLPAGKVPIGCKWVFKVKYRANGEVERYKSRLVVKGYNLKEGIDFKETFSPVVKMMTVRVVLALAAANQWCLHQMDMSNAFL